MTNGTVLSIQSTGTSGKPLFVVTAFSNSSGEQETYSARRVILGTGMSDIIPSTPGIQAAWGKGIYWCPFCDGREHEDQPFGIFCNLGSALDAVEELWTLNTDIIVFVNGTYTPAAAAALDSSSPGWSAWLKSKGVAIDNRTITSLTRLKDGYDPKADPSLPSNPEYDLFQVNFSQGLPVNRSAFYTSWPSVQSSLLGQNTGVAMDGNKMLVSPAMNTSIPGIYAIGDANNDNSTNVLHALWSGKRASVAIHCKSLASLGIFMSESVSNSRLVGLAAEDYRIDVAALTNTTTSSGALSMRSAKLSEREVWEIVNPPEGEILHVGEYNQAHG